MIRRGAGRRAGRTGARTARPLTVTPGGERVHLVHLGDRPPASLIDLAGLLGPAGQDEVVVVVGSSLGDGGVDALCDELAPALEESRKADIRVLRLVMSAGADEAGGRHSAARLLCERWGLDVLATAGAAVVVPDGSLFSPDLPGAPGGWWHFATGQVPRRVGSRLPVPDWEPALERVGRETADGHVVEAVPAGLLVRPAQATAPVVHALPYAVPPDPDRPHVLLGAPGVPAEALADVLAALPGRLRRSVRLLSLDGQDLIGTGQAVADLIGAETRVVHGIPVITEGAAAGEAPVSLRMVGADGTPSWRPYVESVVCPPVRDGVRPPVRVGAWRAPAGLGGESTAGTDPDALPLDGRWKAAVTPAGLWIGPRSTRPPRAASERPVAHDVVAVDLGAPRRALDDSLWPHLDALLRDMEPEERERAVVHVHGVLGAKGMDRLRRLAVRHGFSLLAPEQRARATQTHTPDESGPEGEPEAEGSVPAAPVPGIPLATTSAHAPDAFPAPDVPDVPDAPDVPDVSSGQPAYATAGTSTSTSTGTGTGTSTSTSTSTRENAVRTPVPPPSEESRSRPAPVARPAVPQPSSPQPSAPQTDHERLRASLGPFWERHAKAATQAMTRMPGMRAQDTGGASLAHLAAVHVYLTAVDASELGTAVADDDESTLTLLRCLEWGLRRLPSYRGAVVSTGPGLTARLTPDLVGTRLDSEVPVRGTAVEAAYPSPTADHVLIWSVTGRRTDALVDGEGREILFSRHSGFRVLDVVRHGPATVGLLRELPPHDRSSGPAELSGADTALLERLRTALDLSAVAPAGPS